MSLKIILLFGSLEILTPFTSTAYTSIEHLLEHGQLMLEITSKGGHQGECLRIHAKNIGDAFFVTKLVPGRILISEDLAQQDILLTEEVIIALSPSQRIDRSINGFCYQSSASSPQNGTKFFLGSLADRYTEQAANYLNQHRDIPLNTQQAAIWVLSDCHPMSAIDRKSPAGDGFVSYLADLLQLPKPWYTSVHLQTVDELYSSQVLRIYGNIPFEITDYSALRVQIIASDDRIVKEVMHNARYGPGAYTVPLDLHVAHWEHDTYQVQLFANDHLIKEAAFEI